MTPSLVPELYVTDLENSLSFYRDLLGFETVYTRPAENFAYIRRNNADLMLEEIGERSWLSDVLSHPFGRGVNFQIKVASIDALYAECSSSRAIIKVPLEHREYLAGNLVIRQTQFVVQDPDGYLIRLAEVHE